MKNGKVQMTGITAVATANGNGNGNGNGHKKAEVKETAQPKPAETAKEKRIVIIPKFDQLTTKGVEMFADMGKLENAKLFIDDLAMEMGGEYTTIAGLTMLLEAIKEKDQIDAHDYINFLQTYLFNWTPESDNCAREYIKAVKTGNFVVGNLIETDSSEVRGEEILPPKHKLETRAAKSDILDETLLEEPARLIKNYKDLKGIELAELLSDLYDNPHLPLRISELIFEGIFSVADPDDDEEADFSPEYILKVIEFQKEAARRHLRTLSKIAEIKTQFAEIPSRHEPLGSLISKIITHPDTPDGIFQTLMAAINETHDDFSHSKEFSEYEASPERIQILLDAHRKFVKRQDAEAESKLKAA